MEVDSRVFSRQVNVASEGKRGMEDFWLGGESDSDITETYRRIWGREEDASSVFDMGVKLFSMTEHTLKLIKKYSSVRCKLKYLLKESFSDQLSQRRCSP